MPLVTHETLERFSKYVANQYAPTEISGASDLGAKRGTRPRHGRQHAEGGGDLAAASRLDPSITDRFKDMNIGGGLECVPHTVVASGQSVAEVEQVLAGIDSVAELAFVGVADGRSAKRSPQKLANCTEWPSSTSFVPLMNSLSHLDYPQLERTTDCHTSSQMIATVIILLNLPY